MKSSKLRASAKGKECLLRMFPHCEWLSETVVLCHLPTGDGTMGGKGPDHWAVYGCRTCHDILDGRKQDHTLSEADIRNCMWRGLYLTQLSMIQNGLITTK